MVNYKIITNNFLAVEAKPVHISEMIIGNPNTMVKDRSPLWKDFNNNKLERPFMVYLFSMLYLI